MKFASCLLASCMAVYIAGCADSEPRGSGFGGSRVNENTWALFGSTIDNMGENMVYILFLDTTGLSTMRMDGAGGRHNNEHHFEQMCVWDDGYTFSVKCTTGDSTISLGALGGKSFRLQDGAVFLCSISKRPIEVKQLLIPFEKFSSPKAEIGRIVDSHAEVAEFVSKKGNPEANVR
ncbi:MAG: hypothetical protein QF662_05120 [Phycisphaerae bacterium]|nr:hypothetical protein [Phycisphaerae bacterium]